MKVHALPSTNLPTKVSVQHLCTCLKSSWWSWSRASLSQSRWRGPAPAPPTRRMHSSNEIESLFQGHCEGLWDFLGVLPSSLLRLLIRCTSPTSACPPPHPPRKTFSTPMTHHLFIWSTPPADPSLLLRLSSQIRNRRSLPTGFFFSSDQDLRGTQMKQIRTERTHLWMEMLSVQADANAERTPVDAKTERASVDALTERLNPRM